MTATPQTSGMVAWAAKSCGAADDGDGDDDDAADGPAVAADDAAAVSDVYAVGAAPGSTAS